jgi:hypothetical protein
MPFPLPTELLLHVLSFVQSPPFSVRDGPGGPVAPRAVCRLWASAWRDFSLTEARLVAFGSHPRQLPLPRYNLGRVRRLQLVVDTLASTDALPRRPDTLDLHVARGDLPADLEHYLVASEFRRLRLRFLMSVNTRVAVVGKRPSPSASARAIDVNARLSVSTLAGHAATLRYLRASNRGIDDLGHLQALRFLRWDGDVTGLDRLTNLTTLSLRRATPLPDAPCLPQLRYLQTTGDDAFASLPDDHWVWGQLVGLSSLLVGAPTAKQLTRSPLRLLFLRPRPSCPTSVLEDVARTPSLRVLRIASRRSATWVAAARGTMLSVLVVDDHNGKPPEPSELQALVTSMPNLAVLSISTHQGSYCYRREAADVMFTVDHYHAEAIGIWTVGKQGHVAACPRLADKWSECSCLFHVI